MDFCCSPTYAQNTNVVKLYDSVMDERREDSKLKQRKYYLKGIGACDVDHLSPLERAGKAVYSGLEMAFALSVLREYVVHD